MAADTVRGLDVQLNVLGSVRLLVDGTQAPLSGDLLTRLLTLLAVGPKNGMLAKQLESELWRGRDVKDARQNLHSEMRRLRRLGLQPYLPRQEAGRYRLTLDRSKIDAWQLKAIADRIGSANPPTDDELEVAITLWRGDPADATGLARSYSSPFREALARIRAERDRRTRPRILIIDDKVGAEIAAHLGDYRCAVITRVNDFWPMVSECDDRFDLILVDLHLTEQDLDQLGLSVLAALRRSSVPTVLMSYRHDEGDAVALQERYNLLAFYTKGGNTPGTDFSGLRLLVDDLLGADTDSILLGRLDGELARRERKAGKRLKLTGGSDQARKSMLRHVDRVRTLLRTTDSLAEARDEMAAFSEAWLPGEA